MDPVRAPRTRFFSVAENNAESSGKGVSEQDNTSMIQARHDYIKNSEGKIPDRITEGKIPDFITEENREVIERSPLSKRQRQNNLEDLIWSVEANSTIKTFVNSADNETIRELLNCYDVDEAERKDYTKTRTNMEECIQTWHMKEQKIIETIGYMNDEVEEDEIRQMNCEDLLTLLIHQINNKMPKWCTECHDWYSWEKGSKPQVKCIVCNLGMHDCNTISNHILTRGFKWLCGDCSENEYCEDVLKTVRFRLMQKEVNKIKEVNSVSKEDSSIEAEISNSNMNKEPLNITNKRKRSEEIEVVEIVADIHDKIVSNKAQREPENGLTREDIGGIIMVENRGNENENQQNNGNNNGNNNSGHSNGNNNGQRKRTCTFWAKDKCKHGNECRYLHPERCTAILAYGECLKTNCNLFHPKMCRNIKNTGKCARGNYCHYTHQKIYQVKENENQKEDGKDRNKNFKGGRSSNHNSNWQNRQTKGYHNCCEQDNNGRRHNNEDFLWPNWETMRTPIMERAAQILAEKMMM